MSDGRVQMERDEASGIARVTFDNPARKNAYDPDHAAPAGRVARRARRTTTTSRSSSCAARAACSAPAPTWTTRTRWYGDGRAQRTARRRRASAAALAASTARPSTSTTSSWATRRSPSPRSGATRSAAGSSSRSWPTSPSSARDAVIGMPGDPVPRARRSARCTCSSTASARCWPGGCCSPATRSPAVEVEHLGVFTEVVDDADVAEARAEWWAEKVAAHARRRHRDGQGGLPPRRAAAGVPGRGGR